MSNKVLQNSVCSLPHFQNKNMTPHLPPHGTLSTEVSPSRLKKSKCHMLTSPQTQQVPDYALVCASRRHSKLGEIAVWHTNVGNWVWKCEFDLCRPCENTWARWKSGSGGNFWSLLDVTSSRLSFCRREKVPSGMKSSMLWSKLNVWRLVIFCMDKKNKTQTFSSLVFLVSFMDARHLNGNKRHRILRMRII